MKSLGAVFHRSVAVLACCAVCFQSLPLAAQTSDADARRHFDAAESYYRTSDYEGALREFQQAYALSKRAVILLNIAAVYERMGKLENVVETLDKYLVEDPETSEKGTIQLRIENLKRRIKSQKPVEPPPVASASAAASVAPPLPVEASPPPASPNYTPALIGLGVGGAAAIGAVVTGILAQGKYNDADDGCAKTATGCSDSEVSSVKTMALVSTILTGVAVAGVGVGSYLYFTAAPSEPTEKSTGMVPKLSAGATASGARISARWSF